MRREGTGRVPDWANDKTQDEALSASELRHAMLQESLAKLKLWISSIYELWKPITLVSLVFGLVLLNAYLGSSGSPMLILDSSFITTLTLIVLGHIFASFLLVGILAFPVFTCQVFSGTDEYNIRERYRKKALLTHPERNGLLAFVKGKTQEIMMFHASSILMILTFALAILTHNAILALMLVVPSVLIGLVVSAIAYMKFGVSYSGKLNKIRGTRGKSLMREMTAISLGGFVRTLSAIIWMIIILRISIEVLGKALNVSGTNMDYWISIVLVFFSIIYILIVIANFSITDIFLLVIISALSLMIIVPSYAGSVSLRIFGIGGGIPISMIVKSMPLGGQTMISVRKTGCLIIRSGSEIIVRTYDNYVPTRNQCEAASLPNFGEDGYQKVQIFGQVEVIPASQVLQIDKLASGDGRSIGELHTAVYEVKIPTQEFVFRTDRPR